MVQFVTILHRVKQALFTQFQRSMEVVHNNNVWFALRQMEAPIIIVMNEILLQWNITNNTWVVLSYLLKGKTRENFQH